MQLRNVELGDVDAYVRMRCDPAMTEHLGGPRAPEAMADKVRRDVDDVYSGRALICMIVPGHDLSVVAGTVTLWRHGESRNGLSEIGWMVLPEFQRRGLAKLAVRALLDRVRTETRWGTVHAFPAVDNEPSNAICRSVGFSFVAQEQLDFAGQSFAVNHWEVALSHRAPKRSRHGRSLHGLGW